MKPTISPFSHNELGMNINSSDANPPPNHDLSLQNIVSTALSQADLSTMAGNSSIHPHQLRSPKQTMTREHLRDIIQEALDILEDDAEPLDTVPRF